MLDREAAYVCQAGNELEKFLKQFEFPNASGSQDVESRPSAPSGAEYLVNRPLESGSSDGPLLVESSINVQSIAALLASVKDDEKDEPMMCDNQANVIQKVPSGADVECDMEADDENITRRPSEVEGLGVLSTDSSKNDSVSSASSRKNAKDVERLLDVLVERLGSLKRKAEDSIQEELQAADAVRKRVQHLKSFLKQIEEGVEDGDEEALVVAQKSWKKSRLNRMLIDHLLREGMYDTARKLAEDLEIKELTNVDVSKFFGQCKIIFFLLLILIYSLFFYRRYSGQPKK